MTRIYWYMLLKTCFQLLSNYTSLHATKFLCKDPVKWMWSRNIPSYLKYTTSSRFLCYLQLLLWIPYYGRKSTVNNPPTTPRKPKFVVSCPSETIRKSKTFFQIYQNSGFIATRLFPVKRYITSKEKSFLRHKSAARDAAADMAGHGITSLDAHRKGPCS
jgi:hypothetical protein